MIKLFKLEHESKVYIGINTDKDCEENALKKLLGYKTSSTYKCGYLPYSSYAYAQVKNLPFPYIVSKSGTADNSVSKSELASIDRSVASSTTSPSESREKVTIPEQKSGILEIKWSGKYFTIALPYSTEDVLFLKSLKRSYWNEKYSCWIVGTRILNLERLQKHFVYWSADEYQKLYELISLQEQPLIVELYQTPELLSKVCIKVKGFRNDLSFIKQISGRLYDKEYKRWIIPYDTQVIVRLVDYYEKSGCKVVNRIAKGNRNSFAKNSVSTGKKVKHLLTKFPHKQQGVLDNYASTMLMQKYGWSTIRSYVSKLSKFMVFYPNKEIKEMDVGDVNAFLTHISKREISESLLNVYMSAIKLYYEKVEYRADFKIDRLKRPRKGRYLPTILSENEVDRMMRQLTNLKHIAMAFCIYSGGMRLAEVLAIRMKDINWDRNQIILKGGKGNKDRMTLLSRTLKVVLQKYFDEYQPQYWLFEGQDKKSPYSPSSLQRIIRSAGAKAGIARKVTPHTLRHCFATHLLDRGTDVRYIQELLGHKDIKTTLIYTHVTTRSLENIVSPLDRLGLIKEKP